VYFLLTNILRIVYFTPSFRNSTLSGLVFCNRASLPPKSGPEMTAVPETFQQLKVGPLTEGAAVS
jgi:hypothetical protein